jgi:hypothetical protein
VGTHAELMHQQGIYYRLYQLQYATEEEPKPVDDDTAAKL